MNLDDGLTSTEATSAQHFVWPVRGASLGAGSDSTIPTITAFKAPSSSTNLLAPISAFAGTDNTAVTAYCVSEVNSPASCAWFSDPPSYFSFASAGNKTLYGFVRDQFGNVSASSSAPLTVTLSPNTGGMVALPATGQTASYAVGDDGHLRVGVALPASRYTANADATVTDNLTGLAWSKDANLITTRNATFDADGTKDGAVTWQHALDYIDKLNAESYLGFNDWRLPNRNEQLSLIDRSAATPALTAGVPFTKVQSAEYWTSSSLTGNAWKVNLDDGLTSAEAASAQHFVWPVRGGAGETITTGFLQLSVSPSASQAPGIPLDTSGTTQIVTLSNSGPAPIVITACTLSGGNASSFSLNPGGGAPCSSLTPTIASGGSCTLAVGFWPTTFGAKSANIQISSGTGTASQSGIVVITGNVIDVINPIAVIEKPSTNLVDAFYSIEGTASDTGGSGLSKVEFQFTDGTHYLGQDNTLTSSTPVWVNPTGTSTWSFALSGTVSSQLVNGRSYTITVRATDFAGNAGTKSLVFTKVASLDKAFSQLSLDSSSAMILQGGNISLGGKLTRLPDNGSDLSGQTITLTVIAPDGSQSTASAATSDAAGHFHLDGVTGLTQKGAYTIQASFVGTASLSGSNSPIQTVLVGSQAGYAIIVEGKIANDPDGLASHSKTANRIYNTLKARGFPDDGIDYLSYQTSQQASAAGVTIDGVPSLAAVKDAVTIWAQGKLKAISAPLYIIMIDHGTAGEFLIDTEVITPDDLNGWLNTLESSLVGTPAAGEKRIVIDGSCFSGSFMPALKGKAGRVVIASAAANEESYKGPMEPDGVRSGEFFLDALFQSLGAGHSLSGAFAAAADKVRLLTMKGGLSSDGGSFGDGAVQHPLLDDDGNGVGSNVLALSGGDGTISQGIYLGVGNNLTNGAGNPEDLTAVTATTIVNPGGNQFGVWLTTLGAGNQIASAWAEVRIPGITLNPTGTQSGQLTLDLPRILFTPDATDPTGRRWTGTANLSTLYPNGGAADLPAGRYEVYYYARNAVTSNISPMQRSVVYKQKTVNNAPTQATLTSPQNASYQSTMLGFAWSAATDQENDPFTYTLEIATDAAFANMSYSQEEIPVASTYVPYGVLSDLTTYYWRIKAIDQYGAASVSQSFNFTTNNTNGLPGVLMGYLRSDGGSPITGATIKAGNTTAKTQSNGGFLMVLPTGSYNVSVAAAAGYQLKSISPLLIRAGVAVDASMSLTPLSGVQKPGDCNRDGAVDATEVQNAVGMFLGVKQPAVCVDLDGNNAVSASEMQKTVNGFQGH